MHNLFKVTQPELVKSEDDKLNIYGALNANELYDYFIVQKREENGIFSYSCDENGKVGGIFVMPSTAGSYNSHLLPEYGHYVVNCRGQENGTIVLTSPHSALIEINDCFDNIKPNETKVVSIVMPKGHKLYRACDYSNMAEPAVWYFAANSQLVENRENCSTNFEIKEVVTEDEFEIGKRCLVLATSKHHEYNPEIGCIDETIEDEDQR